jgi:hypothetical protein
MAELLAVYFTVDHAGSVVSLLVLGAVFAAVRRSERIKPVKARRNG